MKSCLALVCLFNYGRFHHRRSHQIYKKSYTFSRGDDRSLPSSVAINKILIGLFLPQKKEEEEGKKKEWRHEMLTFVNRTDLEGFARETRRFVGEQWDDSCLVSWQMLAWEHRFIHALGAVASVRSV